MTEAMPTHAQLREHAGALRLHGLRAHWAEVMGDPQQAQWVAQMLSWEAAERGRRSLERRLSAAHIGRFKPLADFDWSWPRSIAGRSRPMRIARHPIAGLSSPNAPT